MAKKGAEKNTRNKALHSKLMGRKKNKLREEKQRRQNRLKAILEKANKDKAATASKYPWREP
jgi:hypothetical protein